MCRYAQILPAFVAALKSGDEAEALRLLADEGSLVGLKETEGETALHCTAENGLLAAMDGRRPERR